MDPGRCYRALLCALANRPSLAYQLVPLALDVYLVPAVTSNFVSFHCSAPSSQSAPTSVSLFSASNAKSYYIVPMYYTVSRYYVPSIEREWVYYSTSTSNLRGCVWKTFSDTRPHTKY